LRADFVHYVHDASKWDRLGRPYARGNVIAVFHRDAAGDGSHGIFYLLPYPILSLRTEIAGDAGQEFSAPLAMVIEFRVDQAAVRADDAQKFVS
jgi:hypothetical protein